MTLDGGGWTKVLQVYQTYIPTQSAAGQIAAAETTEFAKLSDAIINAIPKAIWRMTQGLGEPVGGKAVFLQTSAAFNDTARSMGLFEDSLLCLATQLESCSWAPASGGLFDTYNYGAANGCSRYFFDYGQHPYCYRQVTGYDYAPADGTRCVNGGKFCNSGLGRHEVREKLTLWVQ